MADRVRGCDISGWQSATRHIDFGKMYGNGARFCFIKSSQIIVDKDFVYNWQASRAAGLLRGAYHFLDWRKSELDQADLFINLLRDDPGELPPVCDFEITANQPPKEIMRGKLWNFLTRVQRALGVFPIIYTGYYHWNEYGSKDAGWTQFPFWLAWYASEAYIRWCTFGGDGTPKPWKHWTFWQYSCKGDGLAYGVESKQIDLNYFNGTEAQLREWAENYGGIVTPPKPPEPPVDHANEIQYRVRCGVLNVRSGPGTNYPIVGTLSLGATVWVRGYNAAKTWGLIGGDERGERWCCVTSTYCEKVV
jgi:lysozyme